MTIIVVFTLIAMFSSGCSATKHLEKDQLLYRGTEVTVTDKENIVQVDDLEEQLDLLPPKGSSTGWLNIYSGFYNLYDSTGQSGFKHWVKNKLGKPPVIFKEEMINNTEARMDYYLRGKGYFSSQLSCDSTAKDRQVKMSCEVYLGKRYRVDSLAFPDDTTYNTLIPEYASPTAVLKKYMYYDRNRLAYERSRLTTLANNYGYPNFSPENIVFYVDTTVTDDRVHVYLELLQPSDSTFHKRYRLGRINIYPNYALDSRQKLDTEGMYIGDSMYVYENEHLVNHKILQSIIREYPGNWYSKQDETSTINRLLDLGIFKSININNHPTRKISDTIITQDILLTPQKMQSITGEVELNNRSGNFFGSGLSLSYIHRNFLKGAERLKLSLSGNVEAQIGDDISFINSSDVSLSGDLSFPRFIVPFVQVDPGRNFIPRTVINANFTFQRRIQYYSLYSTILKYGLRWRETSRKSHEIFLSLNQLLTSDETEEFKLLLDEDARLRRSFDDVFIPGLQYGFTYNDQSGRGDRNYTFFRAEAETAGHLFALVLGANKENRQEILGRPFAQFSKLTFDFRKYFPVGGADLATRILIGGGVAYGNATDLPYTKQYLIGGSNSVRAFPLRGLGPGTFVPDPAGDGNQQFIDQTGDLKLEWNIEYRFPIFRYLKGALFLEGGNIWLVREEDRPEGKFSFSDFYKEIAIGTGFGFRLDFNFFLIRLDLGFPLRAPVYNEGFQWKTSEIDLFDSGWRAENLRGNIGIGYPF